MNLPKVIKLSPVRMEKIWGVETWEISDLEGAESTVKEGPLSNVPLGELNQKLSPQLFGPHFSKCPLLIKWITTEDKLSVQVHPSNEDIKKYDLRDPNQLEQRALHKDECWFIAECNSNSSILHGLKSGTSKESFSRSIQEGNSQTLLKEKLIHPGDLVHVPPGTPHSIGAGIKLLEVQTPSDTTYRVFDYNRLSPDGEPRKLHIEQALQSINFSKEEPEIINSKNKSILLSTHHYSLYQYSKFKDLTLSKSNHFCTFGVLMRGRITLEETSIEEGETFLIPASVEEIKFSSNSQAHLLLISPVSKEKADLHFD